MADNAPSRISHMHTMHNVAEELNPAEYEVPVYHDQPEAQSGTSPWLHSGEDAVIKASQADHEAWLHLKTEHAKLRHPGDRADHNPAVY